MVLSFIRAIACAAEGREEASMPFVIKKFDGKYYVVNRKTGKRKNKVGYKTIKSARKLLAALKINVEDA